MRGKRARIHTDVRIARVCEAQGGVAARWQLIGAGVSATAVDRRLAAGRLRVVHRGVYALAGRRLDREAQQQAAWLAIGDQSAVSAFDAAWSWKLCDVPSGPVWITVPRGTGRKRREGITLLRAPLTDGDWVWRNGRRITTPARTLLDIADLLDRRALERVVDEAHYRQRVDTASIAAMLERNAGRRGAASLRRLLEDHELGSTRTESGLEEMFVTAYQRYGRHRFRTQQPFPPYRADLYFAAQHTIVEIDGPAHRLPSRRVSDARRDAVLAARGLFTIRVSDEEMDAGLAESVQRVDHGLDARSERFVLDSG